MEVVAYAGWSRNARLVAGDVEMIVTLEVGPRILRYGFVDGPNFMKNYVKDLGKTGGDEYRSYGGHRLWIAPEESPKTLHPDNGPVEVSEEGDTVVFTAAVEKWYAQKEVRIRPDAGTRAFHIEHRVYNRGVYDLFLAPWAITVVETGGVCLWPQADFLPHSEKVLPARPVVMWGYTNMSDPRFTWGKHLGRLAHREDLPATKVGAQVEQGYAAYALHNSLFLKRFGYEEGAQYPDYGCNFECFTREDMLEVESLSPLQTVKPGAYAAHRESWYLLEDFRMGVDEEEIARKLREAAATRPLG